RPPLTGSRTARRHAALATHHDDHAGGVVGVGSCGVVTRHRLRLAASFRYRNRGWLVDRTVPEPGTAAGLLRMDGWTKGRVARRRGGSHRMRSFFSQGLRRTLAVAGVLVLPTGCALLAQLPSPTQAPSTTQTPGSPQQPTTGAPQTPTTLITIELAKKNNPTLQANRTLISQNKEQEVTANLRPNPVLSWDTQFLPLFTPDLWTSNYIDNTAQFDMGLGYLFERGRKRQHRLQAAKDLTAVTEAQVADAERTTVEIAAQQFIAALLAKSNLQFAEQLLQSYQHTVGIGEEQYKAGGMSKVDLLKIQLQTLQFQSDVSAARIAKAQALGSLRQLMGFDSVPRDYDVAGDLI